MKKRLISIVLALVMTFSLLPISASAASNQDLVWSFLKSKGFSDAGAAGIMGNLKQESSFKSNNLEGYYEPIIGMNDEEYTAAVDNGTYTKSDFMYDHAGYGLCQWTYYTRKEELYDYIKGKGKSIADLTSQLEFMYIEMNNEIGEKGVNELKAAVDVSTACLKFHEEYENSADTESMKQRRIKYALEIYDAYSNGGAAPVNDTITVMNYNHPTSVKPGSSFSLYGTVVSGKSDIKELTVGIYDTAGVLQTGKTVYPNAKTYSISDIDSYIRFGTLDIGTYRYKITAKNSSDTYYLVNILFKVEKTHKHECYDTWNFDTNDHWQLCWCGEVCGKTAHKYGSWKYPSTICTKDGYRSRSCSVCGYKQTEEISKQPHVYSNGKCTRCGEPEKIEITTQPKSIETGSGKSATFSIKAQGYGLTYQWQYLKPDGSGWKNSGAVSGKTANYSVSAREELNGYKYRCVVKSSNGETKNSKAVSLTVDPNIKKQPVSLKAASGTTGQFSISVSGEGLKYQWQYMKAGSSTWTDNAVKSAKTDTLSVNVRESLDGCKYRCIVTNSCGNTVTSSVVTLSVVADITKQPTDLKEHSGEMHKLSISAKGSGLKYQWQFQKPDSSTWTNSSASNAKTATLSVNVRSAINGYKYRCRVTNSCGNVVTSKVVTLTVIPTVFEQPTALTAAAGTTGKFSVEADGADLSYQWQYQKPGSSTWINSTAKSGKTAYYSVSVRGELNAYKYRCKLTDANGITVTTDAVALTVTAGITKEPTDLAAASGTIGKFNISADGAGLSYQWQYMMPDGDEWINSTAKSGRTDTLCVNVREAINGYKYHCVVTDASGNVITSEEASLTVTPNITKQPSNLKSAGGRTGSFSISASGDGLSYRWQYMVPGSSTWTDSVADSAASATFLVSVRSAINGYKYRCIVTNSCGNSVTSNVVKLTVT